MESPRAGSIDLQTQYEQMLHNAVLVTEMAMELKERVQANEKYVCYLRSLAVRASRAMSAMQNSAKAFTLLGQRLTSTVLRDLEKIPNFDSNMQIVKQEFERLTNILDKELLDMDDIETTDSSLNNDFHNVTLSGISERLKSLESKQRNSELSIYNTRNFRCADVDEKYPENWSRESLIDLNNVVNLPPVPEDTFTGFAKPMKTSSLSSLKSIRKVKLYLQRAATSEDEESECDEHDFSISDEPTSSSEGGETRSASVTMKKTGGLGNITEEVL